MEHGINDTCPCPMNRAPGATAWKEGEEREHYQNGNG